MSDLKRDQWPDPLGPDHQADATLLPPPMPPQASQQTNVTWRILLATAVAIGIAVRVVYVVTAMRNGESARTVGYFFGSALLYVGVPSIIAWGVAKKHEAHTAIGYRDPAAKVMMAVTFALLLIGTVVGEGAICVLIVSPLAYGVALAVTGAARWLRRYRAASLGIVMLLLPVGQVGEVPEVQTVTVVAGIETGIEEARENILAGPALRDVDRPLAVRAGLPWPTVSALPDGEFTFDFGGAGATTFQIERSDVVGGSLFTFKPVADTAPTSRWLEWRSSTLLISEQADGHVVAELVLEFAPQLAPSWYFAPIERVVLRQAGEAMLASMGFAPTVEVAG